MQRIIYRLSRLGGLLLLALLTMPFSAVAQAAIHTASTNQASSTPINAIVYLPMSAVQPLFQQQINQQVPTAFNSAINSMVNKMSVENRGWASQMASALLQPSATLVSLKPQQDGMAATLRLSLYQGDPSPTDVNLLVTMSVQNSTTVQISAKPMPGSPTLVNGPLTTMQIPFGQLSSINTTLSCGDSALAVHLQMPMALSSTQGHQATTAPASMLGKAMTQAAQANTPAYLEIPASSLSSMGSGIGKLDLGNNMTAQNIQVTVQGGQLVATSDIYMGGALLLGKATSYMQPRASQGKLTVHVVKTTMTVFSIFTFPDNTYNQKIEQSLNSKLDNALAGKFYATSAAIGTNTHVPCAAANSLILTGTTSMG